MTRKLPYLIGMTRSDEIPHARIRFAPCGPQWPEWMIATVDGVSLSSAPVKIDDLAAAITELVTRLGTPTGVEVHHPDGSVRHAVVDPACPQLQQLTDPPRRH